MKTCTKCGETKPFDAFPAKGGLRCRVCCAEYLRQYRVENKAALNEKQREKYAAQPDEFHVKEKERNRARYHANRESELSRGRDYYRRNKDAVIVRTAQYAALKPHVKAKASACWRKRHPDKNKVVKAAYYARRRNIPAWGDRKLMADIYAYARIMREAGIDCHVDHIVPLRGKRVSGLHTHANLTVILAKDNLRKGAKFTV